MLPSLHKHNYRNLYLEAFNFDYLAVSKSIISELHASAVYTNVIKQRVNLRYSLTNTLVYSS